MNGKLAERRKQSEYRIAASQAAECFPIKSVAPHFSSGFFAK